MKIDAAARLLVQLGKDEARKTRALFGLEMCDEAKATVREIAALQAERCSLLTEALGKHGKKLGIDEPTMEAARASKDEPENPPENPEPETP